MKYLLILLLCLSVGCSSVGVTNEDAGHGILASDVSVPSNGDVVFTISRRPKTNTPARQYYQDMGVNRTATSWFGFGGGAVNSAGTARTKGGQDGS